MLLDEFCGAPQNLFEAVGFGDVVVGPQLQPLGTVFGSIQGTEHDNRGVGQALVGDFAHQTTDFPTIQFRQHDVEQNQVGTQGVDQAAGIQSIAGNGGDETVPAQKALQQFSQFRFVLDDQDFALSIVGLRVARKCCRVVRVGTCDRWSWSIASIGKVSQSVSPGL